MKTIKLNTGAGDSFNEVAKKCKRIAENRNQIVEFDFNGINCKVSKETGLDFLYRDYSNGFTMKWKEVGPNCVENYSPEIESELVLKNAEREKRQQESRNKQKIKDDTERELLSQKVNGVVLDIINFDEYIGWKSKNTDPYGACCFEYCEGWGKLMQIEIAKGKSIAQCAEQTSYELNYLGITGFMYGMAVNILVKCWKHGEELRKWHNKEYNHEGDGVVNPAILTI